MGSISGREKARFVHGIRYLELSKDAKEQEWEGDSHDGGSGAFGVGETNDASESESPDALEYLRHDATYTYNNPSWLITYLVP